MSGFLLDTNVMSELVRKKPEAKVVQWIHDTDEELLYLVPWVFRENILFLNGQNSPLIFAYLIRRGIQLRSDRLQ